MAATEVKLKVAEAIQDDVTKGIVRIDSAYMKDIAVRSGDIVEIQGGRKTVAIVDRAYPGDMGLNIIRMDGLIRRNGKTGIGEQVIVRKANVKEAKRVIIAPAKEGILIKANPIIFKQGLLGRAVVKGDIVSLGGTRTRRSAMTQSPFFDDIFNIVGDEALMGFGLGDLKFMIVDVSPAKEAVIITDSTEVIFNPEAMPEVKDDKLPDVSYEDIGGLDEELKKVREMVEIPLKHPEIFERLGIEPPKGVLLHGPPGTGKTLLAKAVANETQSNFVLINGPEIMSKYYGQSEENLRKKFEDAEKNAPSIIFIDEIDAIASKREETHGEVEKRVVAQLLAIMDGIKSRGKVVVIAASNIPNALDPALRRPGRFDREIEIGVPQKKGRLSVLKIHTRNMPIKGSFHNSVALKTMTDMLEEKFKEAGKKKKDKDIEKLRTFLSSSEKVEKLLNEIKAIESSTEIWGLDHKDPKHDAKQKFIDIANKKLDEEISDAIVQLFDSGILSRSFYDEVHQKGVPKDLDDIAEITYGFVGADLAALCKEAAMVVLRKVISDLNLQSNDPLSQDILEKLIITNDDFMNALKTVRPSALREVLIEKPTVQWEDIGGLDDAKQELKEAVEWPLQNRVAFDRLGIKPPTGVLLYGPPGTGKTLLAKAVANESRANFILVNGPELMSKWVGESEKAVRKIFEKARQASPSIIFFDEIDSLVPKRGSSGGDSSGVTEKVVNQLLTEMNGLQEMKDVVVIGATNRPDLLDSALLRPGRFDRVVLVSVPDSKSRKDIFKLHTKKMPLAKDVKIDEMIAKTEGYVGADIESVCREAAMLALRDDMTARDVKMKYFVEALKKVRPSTSKDIEKMYEQFNEQFRKTRAEEMKDKPIYYG
ncbi:MAG TPA: CDC48 family AAA ATPase [Alphaproteobacteria bacterium]|nr:CDC48 family AAA ATPase [Alphaproteobacteria bacterium]